MFKIKLVDLSNSYTRLPYRLRYSLFFDRNSSIKFTNKNQGYKFIPIISNFITENITLIKSLNACSKNLSLLLNSSDICINSPFQELHRNLMSIAKIEVFLNSRKGLQIEADRLHHEIRNLYFYSLENLKILYKKDIPTAKNLYDLMKSAENKYLSVMNNLPNYVHCKEIKLIS